MHVDSVATEEGTLWKPCRINLPDEEGAVWKPCRINLPEEDGAL